jgi:uncharacterized protein (TIGR02145 family)
MQFYNSAGWIPMGNTGMLATPGSISGITTPCINSTGMTYSIAAVANATGYHWTVPPGANITAGQGTQTVTVSFGSASGVICVAAYNDCYRSLLSCLTITLTPALPVSVSIAANANPVCSGTSVTFTATPVNGGTTPAYQWKKNGTNISGATSVAYAYAPANNDVITCQMTSNAACVSGNPAISTGVTMMVIPNQTVSISITASANPVCGGTPVTFTAAIFNGGTSPVIQWKLNGSNVSGATNSAYTYTPVNNDQITCMLTSNALCATGNPATADPILMTVTPSNLGVVHNPVCYGKPIELICTLGGCGYPGATYTWSNSSGSWMVTGYLGKPGIIDMDSIINPKIEVGEIGYASDAFSLNVYYQPPPGGHSQGCCGVEVIPPCDALPCTGIPTITYGGQVYNTVQIGSQCWFKENLNIGTRINGTLEQTNNSTIEKYCYNDLESNCVIYGGLYQWNEMMQYVTTAGVQGICPTGWHIPTDAQWTTVTTSLGGTNIAGGKMKTTGTIEAGTGLWHSPNTGATNFSGFSAVPAGNRNSGGTFSVIGHYGYWWSSSEDLASSAWYQYMFYYDSGVYRSSNYKNFGFSVRCVRDL